MTGTFDLCIIAGEASGDQYAARVIREVRLRHPGVRCFGIGGDRMSEEGVELFAHVRDTSVMGFVEVAKHYGFFRRLFDRCVRALEERRPVAVLLIDYPGFNLRLARRARRLGIRVVYYVSPQVWAWGRGRIARMRDLVDHLAVVFPFEERMFADAGVPVSFVGHPLLELLPSEPREAFLRRAELPDRPLLAVLPGSRRQEVTRMLPLLLEASDILRTEALGEGRTLEIVVGGASLPDSVYASVLDRYPHVRHVRGMTHGLMEHAHCAFVTSGTATVETACYGTPLVIAYRTSTLNYEIGRRLINVDSIGMPNILSGRRIVPELVQHDATVEKLTEAMRPLLRDGSERRRMQSDLSDMRALLGTPGASARVARLLLPSREAVPS